MTEEATIKCFRNVATRFQRIPLSEASGKPGHYLMHHASRGAKLYFSESEFNGFFSDALPYVHQFAKILRDENDNFVIGTRTREFTDAVITALVDILSNDVTEPVGVSQLNAVRELITSWFCAQSVPRQYFIPCTVTPSPSTSFSIGPLKFTFIDEFKSQHETTEELGAALLFSRFFHFIEERHGAWVATLFVEGRESIWASIVADTAADLAISALQLSDPILFKYACRLTARSMPAWRPVLFMSQGSLASSGFTKFLPGDPLPPGGLDRVICTHRPMLHSIGKRIETYLRGDSTLRGLERAWCDAAYWYHEGITEQYDTIAAAKFETAVEILMRGESSSSSNARLKKTFWAFRDLSETDPLGPGQVTVKRFAKSVVTVRSRVLHGTLSTLMEEMDVERKTAMEVAQQLLIAYSQELDLYENTTTPADNIEVFMEWIHARRFPI